MNKFGGLKNFLFCALVLSPLEASSREFQSVLDGFDWEGNGLDAPKLELIWSFEGASERAKKFDGCLLIDFHDKQFFCRTSSSSDGYLIKSVKLLKFDKELVSLLADMKNFGYVDSHECIRTNNDILALELYDFEGGFLRFYFSLKVERGWFKYSDSENSPKWNLSEDLVKKLAEVVKGPTLEEE